MITSNKRRLIRFLILLGIISLSTLLRVRNWSAFLIYPDSYRYLLAAKNQLFVLDKPLFVYLIKIVGLMTGNYELGGHFVVYGFSLASIPLLYFALKKHFGVRVALISSFLLGASFSHVVWSGYIMPDILAIFFYILSIFFLLEYPLVSGLCILFAVLVRPEYILLFIPTAVFYFLKSEANKIFKLLPSIFLSILLLVLSKPDLATVFSLKSGSIEFIYNFLSADSLIVVLGLGGMYCLYKKQSNWFWYFLANLVLLILIYQVTSPSNWRYGVHLLVGLSAPAGYLINEFWESSAVKGISHLATMVILVVALIQIFFSYRGIRSEHPRLSYETVSASKIKSAYSLPENDAVSYYNEAYAWHLDKEVLNFEELSCQKEVILIEDQPTRDFASLELQKLKNLYDLTELGRFWVDQGYYYKNKVYVEKAPVVLYLAKRVCR